MKYKKRCAVQFNLEIKCLYKAIDFLSVAKNMCKNMGKNISKSLSGKQSQKRLDHAKQSAIDTLKISSKRLIQKTAETICDLIGNKIGNKIIKVSWCSPQNNWETITNENDKEIPKERYTSPEERQKIIDDIRLI